MIINKKVKRTIFENKSRYIGSFVLIVISCMLFTAYKISLPSIIKSVDELRQNCNVEDANFIVQKSIDNIDELERKYGLVLEERKSIDYPFTNDSTLRLLRETSKLDRYSVTKGSAIKDSNDMLIFDKYAQEHKLHIGDTIKIFGKDHKISGFFTEPDYLYVLKSETDLIFNFNAFGIALLPDSAFVGLKDPITFYSVKFDKNNIREFKDYINKNNTIVKWIDSDINPRIDAFDGDISGSVQIGNSLPIMIMAITCFMLAVVMWRLLKGEFVQIGTLYALGYKKAEILRHYMRYPLIVSILGSMVGVILGLFFMKPVMYTQSLQYNLPLVKIDYNILYLVMAFVLPFIFLVPTTVFVVLKALGLPPLALMKGGADGRKVGIIERNLKLNRFSFNTKFKIREIVRNIPRSLIMVLGVTLASMLLLMGFIMQYSIDNMLKDSYGKIYKYDYTYVFNSIKTEKPQEGEPFSLSTYFAKDKNGKDFNFKIQGMNRDSQLIELKDGKGKKLDFNSVIITRPLSNKLGKAAGDTITVENKFTGKIITVKVDKVAEAYIGDFIYIPRDEYNLLNNIPEGSYTGLLSVKKLDIDPGILLNTISKDDVMEGYKSTIGIFRVATLTIAGIACLIGLIIIFIVTSLLIEENRASISLLKILGYNRKRIYSLILNSSSVLVILGYIIAVPLTLALLDKLFEAITSNMDITIPARINGFYIVAGFVVICVTYEISKLLSRRKVINISMADSLKSRVE